jgi:hypothetical protein
MLIEYSCLQNPNKGQTPNFYIFIDGKESKAVVAPKKSIFNKNIMVRIILYLDSLISHLKITHYCRNPLFFSQFG